MSLTNLSLCAESFNRLFQRGFAKINVNWQAKDYYDRLGVKKTATQEEIKKRYHEIARSYHPDVLRDAEEKKKGEKIMSAINDAYDVLKDEKSRKKYDMESTNPFHFNPGDGNNFHYAGPMDDFFRQFVHQKPRMTFRETVHLTFAESAFGCKRIITLNTTKQCPKCKGNGTKSGNPPPLCPACRGQGIFLNGLFVSQCPHCGGSGYHITDPCNQCNATGQVPNPTKVTIDIPLGVTNGSILNFNTKDGNIVQLITNVDEDPLLQRNGNDLHVTVPISIKTAILGGIVEIPTLQGIVKKKVLPGTQPDNVEKMTGAGISPNGHLYIHYKLLIPRSLNRKDKKIMEKFDDQYMNSVNDLWNSNLKSFESRVCSHKK